MLTPVLVAVVRRRWVIAEIAIDGLGLGVLVAVVLTLWRIMP